MTHPVSPYASLYSAPPLLAPGQWRLTTAWLPWRGARRVMRLWAVLMTVLVLVWLAAWLMDAWRSRDTDGRHVAAVLLALLWCVGAWLGVTRRAHESGAVVLRWEPLPRGRGLWTLGEQGMQAVAPERVLQLFGWRLYRFRPVSAPLALRAPSAGKMVWCWVPPLPERDDPADLHRLSCLLTVDDTAFGTLAQSMASSPHEHQQGSVLSTCPPDTDFPDTVCLPERAGRRGRRRVA